MSKEKYINPFFARFLIDAALTRVKADLERYFDQLHELAPAAGGVLVSLDQVQDAVERLEIAVLNEAAALGLNVEPREIADQPSAPENTMYGYNNQVTGRYVGQISIDRKLYERFVWDKPGPDYAGSLLLVWSDGNKLLVPDTKCGSQGFLIGAGGRKYVAGQPWFCGAAVHATMEAYAHLGTKPTGCTAYFNAV